LISDRDSVSVDRQWQYVLENLGAWSGCFSRHSPTGEHLGDIPSEIYLQGVDDNKSINLLLRRYYPDPAAPDKMYSKDLVMDFSAPNLGTLFLPTGAFSEGSDYLYVTSPIWAELALNDGDRRLRLIQKFVNHRIEQLTLVTETRIDRPQPPSPQVKLEDLIGATIIYADGRQVDNLPTVESLVRIDDRHLQSTGSIGDRQFADAIEISDNAGEFQFTYQRGQQIDRLVLMKDGGYGICPIDILHAHPVELSLGWLTQANRRQRIMRTYDENGRWTSVILITEARSNS
jgi:hypothetical protein